jgi:hypothetical protein
LEANSSSPSVWATNAMKKLPRGLLVAAPLAVTFALTGPGLGTVTAVRSERPAIQPDCATGRAGALGQLKEPLCLVD